MNAILYLCALPHQERATVKKLPATARVRIRNPDRGKEIYAQQFRELSCIDGVGLRAGLPDKLHLTSVSHAYGVSGRLEPITSSAPGGIEGVSDEQSPSPDEDRSRR